MGRASKMSLSGGLLLVAATSVWAAQPAEDCTAIASPDARLACYDRQHGRADAAQPARPAEPPAPPTPAAPAAASPGTDAQTPPRPAATTADAPEPARPDRPTDPGAFGREQLPEPTRPPEAPDALVAEVTGAGEGITGRRWYRLDNGQLWEQVTVRRTGIETGDRIELRRSPIGTYHLRRADGSSRSTQVRRRE